MIVKVAPGLYVGDGAACDIDLKRLSGYVAGDARMICSECDDMYTGLPAGNGAPRCLHCAMIEITRDWYIVHAARDPWHRQAVGYTGRDAPKGEREHLIAMRDGELFLNIIDASTAEEDIQAEIFTEALALIAKHIRRRNVLVHCNDGKSRAPTLALLYFGLTRSEYDALSFDDAIAKFRRVYPAYAPGAGMEAFARGQWDSVGSEVPE